MGLWDRTGPISNLAIFKVHKIILLVKEIYHMFAWPRATHVCASLANSHPVMTCKLSQIITEITSHTELFRLNDVHVLLTPDKAWFVLWSGLDKSWSYNPEAIYLEEYHASWRNSVLLHNLNILLSVFYFFPAPIVQSSYSQTPPVPSPTTNINSFKLSHYWKQMLSMGFYFPHSRHFLLYNFICQWATHKLSQL